MKSQAKDSLREQRKRKLGIDCPGKIVWKNWEAGEEYVKKIVIKNVDARAQNIVYALPERKATFLTPYPEPKMLSSGMYMELEIRFCPTEVVEVHDCIEIKVIGRGSFAVYLEALPPFARLTVPEAYDFELCAVSKTYTKKLTMTNTGTIPLSFYWEAPRPFFIDPPKGQLDREESMEMTVYYAPMEASVSLGQAVCKMADNGEVIASMKLSGIGKIPFIRYQYRHRSDRETYSKSGLLPAEKDLAPLVPLNASTSTISFGDVVVGSVVNSEFYVENPTCVPAEVKIRRVDNNLTGPFKVTPAVATIPKGGAQKFKLQFKSISGGSLHVNTFELASTAGNKIFLEARGCGVGPTVKCSTNFIDFGDVNLDEDKSQKDLTRWVQLVNTCSCAARFQFLNTAPGAAFEVEPCIGSIPPKGKAAIRIVFRPSHAINYLRRLVILVHNSADALYLDVLGSAYNSVIRPLPFDLAQIEAFYMRLDRGLGRVTPDELEALATSAERGGFTEEGSEVDQETEREKALFRSIWHSIDSEMKAQEGNGPNFSRRTGRLSYHQIFVERNLGAYPFYMATSQVSFSGPPESQSVTVINNTKAMAMALWCIPAGSVYTVRPLQQDVPPFGKAEFFVSFNPHVTPGSQRAATSKHDVGQYLECFVNYKQMRSFRLCCERSFTPPHCFTLQVNQDCGPAVESGNTRSSKSASGNAGSLLNADKNIFFPPIRMGDTAYQVLSLQNSGDVVLTYESTQMTLHDVTEKRADDMMVYDRDSQNRLRPMTPEQALSAMYSHFDTVIGSEGGRTVSQNDLIFACYPTKGILHPGQHTLVLLQFSPTRYAFYRAEAQFRVANMSVNDQISVVMKGESHIPRIELEDMEKITFRPTCIMGKTSRTLSMINPTCIPLYYRFVPSPELTNTVTVHPKCGYLERGERVWVTATFSPSEPRVYSGFLSLIALDHSAPKNSIINLFSPVSEDHPHAGEGEDSVKEYVTGAVCVGEGTHGVMEVEPISIDCGDISGLQEQTVTITLYNSGMSEIQYEMRTMTRTLPKEWCSMAKPPRLRNHVGVLPGRCHTMVPVTVYPCAGLSDYILFVMTGDVGCDLSQIPSPESIEDALLQPHCELTIRGTHPAIQIADARSPSLRRSHLWSQLNLNTINAQLSEAVIPSEVEDLGFSFEQNIDDLTPVAVDLGVGCENSAPVTVSLLVKNSGDCNAAFKFWLPMESDVSVEHWYQDDENLKEIQQVVDKSIIEIHPKHSELSAGQSVVVVFTYRFTSIGVHKLPVLLRVNESKKVLLMLEGRTLPLGMKTISFHHSSAYDLLPVPLGSMEPPLQTITVENPLDEEVTFHVDTAALDKVSVENFGFPVLQCVNPTGVLAPRSINQIGWYFRPLEAKEYQIDVPISTDEGEEFLLRFTGTGYHPLQTAIEAQRAQLENSFLSIPVYPQLNLVPCIPITLSVDVLRLGAVPYFSVHRRTCTVINHHRHHVFSFQWDARHPFGDHILSVVPMSGVLGPGEKCECKVVLYTGSTSQMVEWPLTCHITNETLLEQETRTATNLDQRHMINEILPCAKPSPAVEIFAEDGVAVAPQPFQRTTCTKPGRGAREGKHRKSVTTIPLDCLSVRGLAARVKAERRREVEYAAALEDEAPASRVIMYNALEVLLQARIMPIDDYEKLYGSSAVISTYKPVLNALSDPRQDITNEDLGPISREDVSVVRDILDELLRTVIAQPKVKASFTEPFIRPLVLYQNCSVSRVKNKMSEKEEAEAKVKETETKEPPILSGFIGNVVEEALEQLISSAVGSIADRSLAQS